jgi:hypothetical protein
MPQHEGLAHNRLSLPKLSLGHFSAIFGPLILLTYENAIEHFDHKLTTDLKQVCRSCCSVLAAFPGCARNLLP